MKKSRRFLSFILCLLLCVSLLPAQIFAEDTDTASGAAADSAEEPATDAADFDAALPDDASADEAVPAGDDTSAAEAAAQTDAAESGTATDSDTSAESATAEADGAEAASAEEPAAEETAVTLDMPEDDEELVIVDPDPDMDNADLFAGYVDQVFYGSGEVMLMSLNQAGDNLTDEDKIIYDTLKPQIESVAAGEVTYTRLKVPITSLITKTEYTAEELGYESFTKDNISEAKKKIFSFNAQLIVNSLLDDCPYELYWYAKTIGMSYGYFFTGSYTSKKYTITSPETGYLRFSFCVASDYSAASSDEPNYTTDSTKTSAANTAASNALQVVAAAADLTDYEKLDYYRAQICDLTSYNSSAASSGSYGDAFQLVYVFDNDATTKVVCEGYAKAFAYLCEMTQFDSSEISCITANGTMKVWGSAEKHMWNIVTMDDGRNYLVDCTNCDTGTIGGTSTAPGTGLFMRPAYSGSVSDGYQVQTESGYYIATYVYTYSLTSNTEAQLTLSDSYYDSTVVTASGTCGDSLTWTLTENGVLSISGTGAMTDWISEGQQSWYGVLGTVNRIVVGEGVTTIGSNAFYDTMNGSTVYVVTLPSTLQSIGDNAFCQCSNLYRVTFTGSAPTISSSAFTGDRLTARYPSLNDSWTEDTRQNYGGVITWKCYCIGAHTVVTDEAVAPTCTETGLAEGSHCSACGEILKAQATVPATGHTLVVDSVLDPTCTEQGYTTNHCSVCGEVVLNNYVAALGHTAVIDEGTPATCTTDGISDGSHCSVCGEVLTAQEVIPALGHDTVTDEAVEPTCTETGLTEGSHCARCGEIFTAQETLPALGHLYDTDPTFTWTQDCSACTLTFACSRCDCTEEVAGEVFSRVSLKPTCTEPGITHYVVMGTFEGKEYYSSVSSENLPALGHSWSDWMFDEIAGAYSRVCANCSGQELIPLGDADGNGTAEQADLQLLKAALADDDLTALNTMGADFNRDGAISLTDLLLLKRSLTPAGADTEAGTDSGTDTGADSGTTDGTGTGDADGTDPSPATDDAA